MACRLYLVSVSYDVLRFLHSAIFIGIQFLMLILLQTEGAVPRVCCINKFMICIESA